MEYHRPRNLYVNISDFKRNFGWLITTKLPEIAKNDEMGILLPKLFWPTVRKKCSSNPEELLKFETEGLEFTKCLRSLEQFIW